MLKMICCYFLHFILQPALFCKWTNKWIEFGISRCLYTVVRIQFLVLNFQIFFCRSQHRRHTAIRSGKGLTAEPWATERSVSSTPAPQETHSTESSQKGAMTWKREEEPVRQSSKRREGMSKDRRERGPAVSGPSTDPESGAGGSEPPEAGQKKQRVFIWHTTPSALFNSGDAAQRQAYVCNLIWCCVLCLSEEGSRSNQQLWGLVNGTPQVSVTAV